MSGITKTRESLTRQIEALQQRIDELDDSHAHPREIRGQGRDQTDSESSTRKLLDSETILRSAFDHNPVMMMIVDVQASSVVDVNQTYLTRLGLARQDVVGIPGKYGFKVASSEETSEWISPDLEQTDSSGLELTLVASNGEAIGVMVSSKPIGGPDERLRVVSLIETGGLREVEASLVASEARFRTVVEHSHNVINLFTPTGEYLYSSPSVERVLGYRPEELVGQRPTEITHPDDIEEMTQAFVSCLTEPRGVRYFTIRVKHKDGSYRTIEVTGTNLLEEPGLNAMVSIFRDVTENQRTEAALRESEERFKTIFNDGPDAACLIAADGDDAGRILLANTATEQMHGYSPGELNGMHIADVDSPEDARRVPERLRRLAAGERLSFEISHFHKDGTQFPVEITAARVVVDGRLCILALARDLTVQKRGEALLREKETQLAHVARVSTIGEMVSGIAHELNQPLFTIQNYGKACGHILSSDDEQDRDKLREWLDQITLTAEFAGEVLTRLRNFVNRVPSERTPVKLAETVETATSIIQHEAEQSGVTVELAIPADLPIVFGDAVEIQQVLVNLQRNAIEATMQNMEGNRRVSVSCLDLGDVVEVLVTDNGPGLPNDSDRRIFETFASTKPQGMGLGLAISKTIVESHGGVVVAKNGMEGGAELRFTLPIQKED